MSVQRFQHGSGATYVLESDYLAAVADADLRYENGARNQRLINEARIRQIEDAAAHWEHKYVNARQYNRNLEERCAKLEAAGNDLRASLVGSSIANVMPDSCASRIKRFDDMFETPAETFVATGAGGNANAFVCCEGVGKHEPGCTAPETSAELCPHGFVLADNTCGPCSEGRPNRTKGDERG